MLRCTALFHDILTKETNQYPPESTGRSTIFPIVLPSTHESIRLPPRLNLEVQLPAQVAFIVSRPARTIAWNLRASSCIHSFLRV